MNFQQAQQKKRELDDMTRSNGWVLLRMDDFQADNMLKGSGFGVRMDVIEAALAAYEVKINNHLALHGK